MSTDPQDDQVELFHYTSKEGLEGILGTQTLWASHFSTLNDSKEIILGRNKFHEIILETILEVISAYRGQINLGNTSEQEYVLKRTQEIMDLIYGGAEGTYITSFSTHYADSYGSTHGILSQWHRYGENGGYCIVLDYAEVMGSDDAKIGGLVKSERDKYAQYINHSNMIYTDETFSMFCDPYNQEDSDSHKKTFEDKIEILIGFVKSDLLKRHNIPGLRVPEVSFEALVETFVNLLFSYKHIGFKEESETRIISVPIPKKDLRDPNLKLFKKRYLRSNNNLETIPYVVLFGELNRKLPIKRIIVGPHSKIDTRAESLKIFLEQNNHLDIEFQLLEYPMWHRD